MTELKPCPFCGGEAKLHFCGILDNDTMIAELSDKYGVHCEKGCCATMPIEGADRAIKLWNSRAKKKGELDAAIRILTQEYERAKSLKYVQFPIAWALYQTWKKYDDLNKKYRRG